jgi:7-cyano-7-deazaguanine reductase
MENELSQLGSKVTKYPQSPDEAVLETFTNKTPEVDYLVPFICTEFTSLCPKTGQPDFAKFEIIYVPNEKMIESKSLKLYLFSFRNEGSFHEQVTVRIFKDLWKAMMPKYMRIVGDFTVRGGIAIKPLVEGFEKLEGQSTIKSLVENWDRVKTTMREI